MRKIILLCSCILFQFVQSQETNFGKAEISSNIADFIADDKYNRFDNSYYNYESLKKFNVEKKGDIIIFRCLRSNGYSGFSIEIHIDQNLTITKARYAAHGCTYRYNVKATKITLQLNQNPFEKLQGIQGQFELKFNKKRFITVNGNANLQRYTFHGKFKLFNTEDSFDINAQKQNAVVLDMRKGNPNTYSFTSIDNVYIYPNHKPIINNKTALINAIKKLNIKLPKTLLFRLQLNKDGSIKKISAYHYKMSREDKVILNTFLSNFELDYTVAQNNGKTVAYNGTIFLDLQ